MFVGFLIWWYGEGLNGRLKAFGEWLGRVSDFFSVGLLAKTLFSPFRQLSVGRVSGPLEAHIRALVDNLTSRLIGAFVRSAMMFAALLSTIGVLIYGLFVIAGWLVLPLLPVCGLVIALMWGISA